MFDYLQRKLNNILAYMNLLELNCHNLKNESRIKKVQDRNVRKLMRKAYKIPFYRAKFDAIGKTPSDFKTAADLVNFPLLTKNEIRNWISTELENNPKKYQHWYRVTTSGSTGTPLMICVSPAENARLTANWLRIISNAGVNPFTDKTMALKDPELIKQRKGKDSIVQKLGLLRRHVISFASSGKTILDNLNSEKPDFLYIHRSKLMETIMYAERSKEQFHKPRLIAVIGEGIDKNAEALFDKHFEGRFFSSYGTMETGACTYTPVGDTSKHIVTRDTHVINIVNEKGELAQTGRMVLTNLFFYGFPIINYDIGDGAQIYTDPKSGLQYISNIKGRINDIIQFSDGSIVDWLSFYTVMERRADVLQFRVVQKEYDLLEIQLVKNPEKAIKTESEICKEIEEALRKVVQYQPVVYMFTWHDELLPDKNGKRRFIVSEVKK